jgi:hypothetical protein
MGGHEPTLHGFKNGVDRRMTSLQEHERRSSVNSMYLFCNTSRLNFRFLFLLVCLWPSPALFAAVAGSTGAASNITGVWANDGGDKVTQDELRVTRGVENLTGRVLNRTWDGTKISLYGAANEVLSFNLVLEAGGASATNVSVKFDTLTGPGGQTIKSIPTSGDGLFSWVNRNIELFYVRYFQIKGLSHFGYNPYIESQVPVRFSAASTLWSDRPDHDKFYPDPLIPLEIVPSFTIAAGTNQSIWADIYVPRTAAPGIYTGVLTVQENGVATLSIPIKLQVYGFALPDTPSAKVMVAFDEQDVLTRYFNTTYLDNNTSDGQKAKLIRDRYFALAHRHKLALLGDGALCAIGDYVCPEDVARLNGSTFSILNGYEGPGRDVGQDVYSIGTYGTWSWRNGATEQSMRQHSDAWVNWFSQNLPKTEYFLYLFDEPSLPADVAQVQTWAGWISANPGPGRQLPTFATIPVNVASAQTPSLSIACTYGTFGSADSLAPAANYFQTTPGKQLCGYNGTRPAVGSFVTEDDGIALRELPWVQYKMGFRRWFYWMLNGGYMSPLSQAHTFGDVTGTDPHTGESGPLYTNGDGILVYPGKDLTNPSQSYGVDGPLGSVRLKSLRRGIQDVDYLRMAAAIDPVTVQQIVKQMVPKALWEVGVGDPADPTWVDAGITWPVDPDAWESARAQLASIIQKAHGTPIPVVLNLTVKVL